MTSGGFDQARAARIGERMEAFVARGEVAGLVWLAGCHGEVISGAAGTFTSADDPAAPGRPVAVTGDTIFRIASMTKPVTAVATLLLVEEGRLRLDDPVDGWLPELADRRVLRPGATSIGDTVPAERPITTRDLLTFRCGMGLDFANLDGQLTMAALAELGLGAGPPSPLQLPPPDEWLRRLGSVPLECQPGDRWLYNVGSSVLGVLIARAAGQPFDAYLRDRLFDPLGMRDTGFFVPDARAERLGPSYTTDPGTGGPTVYDPADGQWRHPPTFPDGAAGLVSTAGDFHAFATMLAAGGMFGKQRILGRTAVELLVTDQLVTPTGQPLPGPDPTGTLGWGFGVGVTRRRVDTTRATGAYGWDGGLGTSWANDPTEALVGLVLTNQMFSSPAAPPVVADFWTSLYAALR